MPNYVSQNDAQALLHNVNRVLVIGCSGGGKTNLAHKLSSKFAFTYLSIDRDVRWLPDWKERAKVEQRAILTALVQQDRWVMDGSGASTFDIRLPRSELVLWVRVPRHIALMGLARRIIKHKGRVRPLMAAGCPEPFPDKAFLSYIWHFEKRYAPTFITQIDLYGPTVPVCICNSH